MMGLIWRRVGENQTPPPWGLYTAIGIAIGAFASILLGVGVVANLGGQSTITTLLAYCLGMGFTALLVTITRNRTPADGAALALHGVETRIPLILMLSFGVGAMLDLLTLGFANVPLVVSEINSAGGVAAIQSSGVGAWILTGLLLLVLQPIGEGLVFWGVAYPALRTILGARSGFFMTAVWYGIFHMVAYPAAVNDGEFSTMWVTLIAPILAGVYISGIRAVSGSTRISMIAQVGLGLFFIVRAFTVVAA